MSRVLFRIPALVLILIVALADGPHLLPLLLGLFIFTVGAESLYSHLTKRWLVDELESMHRAAGVDLPLTSAPPLSILGSLLWQAIADQIWAVADRLVIGPVLAARERRGDYEHQGRHHADRWSRHEVDGTVAQRRPSVAAQQHLVERIVQSDTGELPVIDDTDIHSWLESAKLHQGAT